jgi:anti-sigma factor RsiW
VSAVCDRLERDLPLYAEGELGAPEMRAIRLHLEVCAACRGRVEAYDDFTRRILEEELPEPALDRGGPIEDDSGEPWDFLPRSLASPPSRGSRGAAFTALVMAEVRRTASRRRLGRLRRMAAAILVLAGLGLGGAIWVGSQRMDVETALVVPDPSQPAVPALKTLAVVSVPGARRAATEPPADLASAWWVIDPERERESREPAGGEYETVLYSKDPEEEDSSEGRPILVMKALLGALEDRSGSRPGADLLMVPEARNERGAIPVRPVAYPVRVPERDIAPTARIRIRAPVIRYRIIWMGTGGVPLQLSPVMRDLEMRYPRGSFPLSPPAAGIPISTDRL